MQPAIHYQIGAQFVLLIDTVYPWATFPFLNTCDLFQKGSSANSWWIGAIVCIDISWTILAILGFIFSCFCSTKPKRVGLLLNMWFVSSTFGVLAHLFCTFANGHWLLFTFSLILRIPYFYMVFLYWVDIRNVSRVASREPAYTL